MSQRTNRTKRTPGIARMIGAHEVLGAFGVMAIGVGLGLERVSLALLWFGAVALFITWGAVRTSKED